MKVEQYIHLIDNKVSNTIDCCTFLCVIDVKPIDLSWSTGSSSILLAKISDDISKSSVFELKILSPDISVVSLNDTVNIPDAMPRNAI